MQSRPGSCHILSTRQLGWTYRADFPFGSLNLCPTIITMLESAWVPLRSTGTFWNTCTASVWNISWNSWRRAAKLKTVCRGKNLLLARMRVTRTVCLKQMEEMTSEEETTIAELTGNWVTSIFHMPCWYLNVESIWKQVLYRC